VQVGTTDSDGGNLHLHLTRAGLAKRLIDYPKLPYTRKLCCFHLSSSR
jgi:hypothetical protein